MSKVYFIDKATHGVIVLQAAMITQVNDHSLKEIYMSVQDHLYSSLLFYVNFMKLTNNLSMLIFVIYRSPFMCAIRK